MRTDELYHLVADDFHKIGDTQAYAKAKNITNEIGAANHAPMQAKMEARNAAEKIRIGNIISERVPSLEPQNANINAAALAAAKYLGVVFYNAKK